MLFPLLGNKSSYTTVNIAKLLLSYFSCPDDMFMSKDYVYWMAETNLLRKEKKKEVEKKKGGFVGNRGRKRKKTFMC